MSEEFPNSGNEKTSDIREIINLPVAEFRRIMESLTPDEQQKMLEKVHTLPDNEQRELARKLDEKLSGMKTDDSGPLKVTENYRNIVDSVVEAKISKEPQNIDSIHFGIELSDLMKESEKIMKEVDDLFGRIDAGVLKPDEREILLAQIKDRTTKIHGIGVKVDELISKKKK